MWPPLRKVIDSDPVPRHPLRPCHVLERLRLAVSPAKTILPPMDPRPTADLLKSWTLEAGFDRAGVARLDPLEHGEALVRWLDRGDQAGMAYLGNRLEARLDSSQVFPYARSVLCVALQYHPLEREDGERQPEPSGDLWRRVARYARGRDYHDVMGERLRGLEERVRAAFPGCG